MRIFEDHHVVAVIVGISGLLAAKQNKYGVADVRKVTLLIVDAVGDVMLPREIRSPPCHGSGRP